MLIANYATTLNLVWLLGFASIYYLLYSFLRDTIEIIKGYIIKMKMRCPNCKNRKIFLQGYQGYKSDEQHAYYYCDDCKTISILTDGGLLKI